MTVRQRAKRKTFVVWASQYSRNTGCTYFKNTWRSGFFGVEYPEQYTWSKPK